MTEKKGRLSKAGAAVVAPFAHMQPDACTHTDTHTLKNHLWTHPQEMDLSSGGAEFAAQAHTRIHTHTERLHPHWLTSLHPTAGVSEGSAAVLCSRGLETLEWAIFSPSLLLFLGWISKVHSLPHFPLFSRILVPSVHCSYGIQFLLCR